MINCVKADVVTNFIKDEVESSSDAEVYNDDDDSEEDKVIGLSSEISSEKWTTLAH